MQKVILEIIRTRSRLRLVTKNVPRSVPGYARLHQNVTRLVPGQKTAGQASEPKNTAKKQIATFKDKNSAQFRDGPVLYF